MSETTKPIQKLIDDLTETIEKFEEKTEMEVYTITLRGPGQRPRVKLLLQPLPPKTEES